MAKIKVLAKKDVWYAPNTKVDHEGKISTDGKLYKKGDAFDVEEKDFSDWNEQKQSKTRDGKPGGITLRGSMVKVEEKIINGTIQYVEIKSQPKEEPKALETATKGSKKSKVEDPI